MQLTVFLEKIVANVEEGITFTNIVKAKLKNNPEVKVTSNCIEIIEPNE